MGGDGAPLSYVKAIKMACDKYANVFFYAVGKREEIFELLENHSVPHDRYEIIDSQEVVSDYDDPIAAFRNGKESSIRKGVDLVKDGEAQAFVSSGNTGALMVTAKMVLGMLPGIKRPAIVCTMPSLKGDIAVLDVGANTECSESVLFQFGLMGICFMKIKLNKDRPSVAILNVGSEDHKGREIEKKAAELMRETNINFLGYIEGNEILSGKADVVVTDGFTGNIALKVSEGTAHMIINLLKNTLNSSLINKIKGMFVKSTLKNAFEIIHPSNHNGAMLIGLDGIVIKSHGGADVKGILNAIETAIRLVDHNINAKINHELKKFEEVGIHSSNPGFIERIKSKISKNFK